MQTIRPGGLAGKARRAKMRKRVARLHAQCLIDEYYEPEDFDHEYNRHIPIRGRSDFLPALATGTSSTMSRSDAKKDEAQLNLSLGGEKDERSSRKSVPGDSLTSGTAPTVIPASKQKEEDGEESAIRFTKPRGPTYDLFNLRNFDAPRRKRVSLGGFLVGCALGTMGAGLLLFALRAVLG